ncbi:MAG: type IV pilus secretin PilQ, partial [bacterium]
VQGGVIINTSEADTRVMVEDGQTAVIGGLIRTNDSHVRRGIPLLKDIPLLGALFRSDNTVKQNRELIIFVTPRLMTDMAMK